MDMWNLRAGARCLMPGHYHLLIQTPDANLSRCMRHVNGKRHKEVTDSKNLSPDAERIKEEVCRRYAVAMDELHSSGRGITNEPRNVAIYLLRSLRGDNLEEIGREFNIPRFSSVSSVVERMRGEYPGIDN